MLRRWIPGMVAVVVVLLTAESVFAQRLLDRIRARRESRNSYYSQPVQPVTQTTNAQPATQPGNQVVTETVYERRGLFGRRVVPVTVSRVVNQNNNNPAQAQPATQPASNLVTETVYERRGLFGRRVVPVTRVVAQSSPNTQPRIQPGTEQPAPVAGNPVTPRTVSQGATYYYERRGLFGRRMVPVQSTAATNNQPATRRSYYLEPGSASVLLNVRLPNANAEVLVDGQRTNMVGQSRQFVSPPLAPGFEYTYTVEARWQENGQQVTRTRRVSVQPGREATVDFSQPDPQ